MPLFRTALVALLAAGPAWAQPRPAPTAQTAPQPAAQTAPQTAPAPNSERIIAVVNGDVITTGDVVNRGKLFALSTGLPVTAEVLARLRPQVSKQLVDERLRLQEVQRRKVNVSDREIADAIGEIEQRNGMGRGALNNSLRGQGVALRTLIDQVRVQLGWTRVLRQELGLRGEITDGDVADQIRIFKEQTGKPEFRISEIFIPVDDPAKAGDAQRFADTVIGQLRSGAPFPVVAAQFSQSQTALQGGDLGWVRANQLDPEVAGVVQAMPPGAVSNPVAVPGGISIVSLRARREIGRDQSTVLDIRQLYIPFPGTLNPAAPTDEQRRVVEQAQQVSRTAKSCADVEEANKRAGAIRPSNPGEVRLEGVGSPPLRALLASLSVGVPSKPVIANEGVAVVMICARETKTMAAPSKEEITERLLNERVELTSRQLQRDLRRRAVMEERT